MHLVTELLALYLPHHELGVGPTCLSEAILDRWVSSQALPLRHQGQKRWLQRLQPLQLPWGFLQLQYASQQPWLEGCQRVPSTLTLLHPVLAAHVARVLTVQPGSPLPLVQVGCRTMLALQVLNLAPSFEALYQSLGTLRH